MGLLMEVAIPAAKLWGKAVRLRSLRFHAATARHRAVARVGSRDDTAPEQGGALNLSDGRHCLPWRGLPALPLQPQAIAASCGGCPAISWSPGLVRGHRLLEEPPASPTGACQPEMCGSIAVAVLGFRALSTQARNGGARISGVQQEAPAPRAEAQREALECRGVSCSAEAVGRFQALPPTSCERAIEHLVPSTFTTSFY